MSEEKKMKLNAAKKAEYSRISIGNEIGRWMALRTRMGNPPHREIAAMLLNSYEEVQRAQEQQAELPASSGGELETVTVTMSRSLTSDEFRAQVEPAAVQEPSTSTPAKSLLSVGTRPGDSLLSLPHFAESPIAIETSDTLPFSAESAMALESPDTFRIKKPFESLHLGTTSSSGRSIRRRMFDENVVDVSFAEKLSNESDESEDSEYVPSFNMSRLDLGDGAEVNESDLDSVDGDYFQDHESSDSTDEDDEDNQNPDDVEARRGLEEQKCFIAYEDNIVGLVRSLVGPYCSCRKPYEVEAHAVGTALNIKLICENGLIHHKWCSQPRIKKMNLGDITFSSAIVFSGNNYNKISLLAKMNNMGMVNRNTFFKLQSHYIIPVIEEYWDTLQDGVLEELRGQEVVVCGDGRNDSPGYCAQYCTYTVMECKAKDPAILAIITVDKREVEGKSPNMEKLAFQRAMAVLNDAGVIVKEAVTDQHIQIAALLRKDPDFAAKVKHSWDIWHYAKNLGKKIGKGITRETSELKVWTADIVNHFWYCSKNCMQDERTFVVMWKGMLHHIIGEHTWGSGSCIHEPLPDNMPTDGKAWLKKESRAYKYLAEEIILNKKLLTKDLPYLVNFRHTGELESFQQHILMYNSKRNSYIPPVYHARCLLAGIDHNFHKDRGQKTNKDGDAVYRKIFNKRGGNWYPVPVKMSKAYNYSTLLLHEVIHKYLSDDQPITRRVIVSPLDPRNIQPSIHPAAPPMGELLEEYQRRRRMDTD